MTEPSKQPGTRIARACPDCSASLETLMVPDKKDSARLAAQWVCFRRCGYVFDLADLKDDEPYAYRSASGDVLAPLNRYELWIRAYFKLGLITCECGEIDGCDADAVDVRMVDNDTVALCDRCLTECTMENE